MGGAGVRLGELVPSLETLMRLAFPILALLLAGCTAAVEPTGTEFDAPVYRVQLRNDGAVTLRNVRVTTGPNVPPLTIAELPPGASSGQANVALLHEHPIVSATAAGHVLLAHPVEGFEGFNAQVAPGAYVIQLRYVAEYQALDVTVAAR